MTDDELVALLRRTMRARDAEAPTVEAIRERLDSSRPALPGTRRRWLPAVGVAAVVLVLAAGGVTWEVSRSESGSDPTVSESPPTGPMTHSVTVFYALPSLNEGADPNLVPRQLTVNDTGDPALDAVRALFERPAIDGLTNWFNLEGDPVAEVNSVTVEQDRIVVDVDRSLAAPYPFLTCICPSPETELQQLAWTVSTALETQEPILLTVNGKPAQFVDGTQLTGLGWPNPDVIAVSQRSFPWFREACGVREIVAVTSDGRRVEVPEPASLAASVGLRVGDSLRFDVSGACFDPLVFEPDEPTAILESSTSPDGRVLVARLPGQVTVVALRDACRPTFVATECLGPMIKVGSITVNVTTG